MMKTKQAAGTAYKPERIEPHWQQVWADTGITRTSETSERPRFYCLDYFPYPSGEGLHVGHCRNYVPTDVISRYKRMQGFNVLHPMGWDAFGEPAEQEAVRRGISPRATTDRNTANYKRQLQMIGTSYDWEREIDSSDPNYYRWTQWMFLRLYRQGLAYRDTNWQWWCPTCATTLSSHEISGERCWRGHRGVTKKEIPAWYFKITAYADELIDGLDSVDWPEAIQRIQRNWIGRSEGVEVRFPLEPAQGPAREITTFTTRPDTVYGVTFLALAPEHPLVEALTEDGQRAKVEAYRAGAARLSEIERSIETREPHGVFTGGYARHPLSQTQLPVFVADYILPTYGSGSVMGVPAHDQRDLAFARKYGLEIRPVIAPVEGDWSGEAAFVDSGVLKNSGPFDGLSSANGAEQIADHLETTGTGRRAVMYRMRDWLISRQRYWGTPIPIVHCPACGQVPVPESDLPILLPEMEDFAPDGSGRSPLERVASFVNTTCPACGQVAKRETDTLGGFACSSWYFLRFTNPHYQDGPFDPQTVDAWMPVDLYVGGVEHAVLHLLYARFWTKFLADEGLVSFREPFARLINQGQLHGPDGRRMSKSRGNVIVPDSVVAQYGADALRIYCLFMAPFEQNVDWNPEGISGAWRFLNRVWNLYQLYWNPEVPATAVDPELGRERHKVIKAVSERIESFRFNTMVSALMEFLNRLYDHARAGQSETHTFQECLKTLMVILAPAAPHIAEALWAQCGFSYSVHQQAWPIWDEAKTRDTSVSIGVQVDGRLRGNIQVGTAAAEAEALQAACQDPGLQKSLDGREITRVVYVPGKILNILTRP